MNYYILGLDDNNTVAFISIEFGKAEDIVNKLNAKVEQVYHEGKEDGYKYTRSLCNTLISILPSPPDSVNYLGIASELDTTNLKKVESNGLVIYHCYGDCC